MEKDPKHNTEEGSTEETPRSETGAASQSNQGDDAQPKVVEGALNKALLRTFRSDAAKRLGNKADKALEKFTPPAIQKKRAAQKRAGPDAEAATTAGKENTAVVHTFKGDVQNVVRNRKMSLTRMAALEGGRLKRTQGDEEAPGASGTSSRVILAAAFLVAAGVLGAGGYYAYILNTGTTPTQNVREPAVIFTEARPIVDITGQDAEDIRRLLAQARRDAVFSLGSVVELYLTRGDTEGTESSEERIGARAFMESIEADVPQSFVTALGTPYMVGLHVTDDGTQPFIILTTQSYGHAFSGMLAWEDTLESDLAPFFNPDAANVRPAIAESGNAFSDTVIENLDVRILRDASNTTRIAYTFVTRGAVVITTNTRTLVEIAERLRVANL